MEATDDPIVAQELQEMYQEWPFFKEMIDLIAMTLSKTDYSVARNYEHQLTTSDDIELKELGDILRDKLLTTKKNVLDVTQCEDFFSGFQLLKQSMKVVNNIYSYLIIYIVSSYIEADLNIFILIMLDLF